MKFLTKYIGGSQIYGLNTPESDVDWRGVYLNTEPSKILRFDIDESYVRTGDEENGQDDEVYYELWRYFDLLRKTNTQVVESLYIPKDQFEVLDPRMAIILDSPEDFINSDKLVRSTKGYAQGEYRLAMGERTGRLGGKRKEQLDRFGFSPKNVCQMIRLSRGLEYFQDTGVYPLNFKSHMPLVWKTAYEIKTQPEKFSKEEINDICLQCLEEIDKVEDKLGWTFKQDKAVDILKDIYKPYL